MRRGRLGSQTEKRRQGEGVREGSAGEDLNRLLGPFHGRLLFLCQGWEGWFHRGFQGAMEAEPLP